MLELGLSAAVRMPSRITTIAYETMDRPLVQRNHHLKANPSTECGLAAFAHGATCPRNRCTYLTRIVEIFAARAASWPSEPSCVSWLCPSPPTLGASARAQHFPSGSLLSREHLIRTDLPSRVPCTVQRPIEARPFLHTCNIDWPNRSRARTGTHVNYGPSAPRSFDAVEKTLLCPDPLTHLRRQPESTGHALPAGLEIRYFYQRDNSALPA